MTLSGTFFVNADDRPVEMRLNDTELGGNLCALISDWERGIKKPGGPALRLLTVVKKNSIQAIA